MKNILITGGAGFIGSHVAYKLAAEGYNVRVLDNLSEQIHGKDACIPQLISGKVDFIKGSVDNTEDWIKALEGVEAVIHLAAETGTGQSMYEIERYCSVNVGGTAKLLDILTNRKHSVKKVIVASSRAIYGEGRYFCKEHGIVYPEVRENSDMLNGDFNPKCPVCGRDVECCATKEDSMIHPTSVYGITKQMQEELVMTVCKAIGIPALVYRYQNVYGPGQSLSNPYTGILSIFSTQIMNGGSINIFEDGEEARDFVYIEDVADATIAGLKSNAEYEIFNIGSGEIVTVNKVVRQLMSVYNKKVDVNISGDFRNGDIRNNFADISKAKRLLGYEPKVKFEQGIKLFAEWVKGQEIKSSGYEASLKEMKEKGLFKEGNTK